MIKAIIWDIGGVLAKMDDQTAHRQWERRLGLAAGELVKVVFGHPLTDQAMTGQVTEDAFWQAVGQSFNLSAEDTNQLKHDFHAADVWNTEMLDFIRALKPRYKMGIISGAMSEARAGTQAHLPDDLFAVKLFSAEEGIHKPDPAIYRRALSRLDVAAEEAIFVDDWLASVEGARAVGMHAIHFTDKIDVRDEIKRIIRRQA